MPVYKSNKPTKDGRKFYYKISYTVDGKRAQIVSKNYKTKKEAEKEEANKLLELNKVPRSAITYNQVARVFLAEKKSRLKSQSYDRLETMLNHFLVTVGDVPINQLTLAKYQQALSVIDSFTYHGKPLKNSYKNKLIRTFKQLISFAEKRYDLTTNIPNKIDNYTNEQKEEMQFLTYDEFNSFLSVIDDETYRAFFICLYFMGLRCGEANGLQWENVDLTNNTLSVKQTVNTKKKMADGYEITTPKTKSSYRTLPMPQIVSNAFLGLYDKQVAHPDYSLQRFVFGFYKPIPESTLQKVKNSYFKVAGMPPIRIHDFRHSCASYLINNGATPLLVSKWLGHSNVSMTLNTYSHLWKNELTDIVNLINSRTI